MWQGLRAAVRQLLQQRQALPMHSPVAPTMGQSGFNIHEI